MNKGTASLVAEMRGGRSGDEEAAVQMDPDNGQPILGRHLVEDHVPQDARVVHHGVDPAEMIERGLHDLLGGVPIRDAVRADLGLAAAFANEGSGLLGRTCRAALAGEGRPDIVDDDPRPRPRHHHGDSPADAASGPGDYGNLACEQRFGHPRLLWQPRDP